MVENSFLEIDDVNTDLACGRGGFSVYNHLLSPNDCRQALRAPGSGPTEWPRPDSPARNCSALYSLSSLSPSSASRQLRPQAQQNEREKHKEENPRYLGGSCWALKDCVALQTPHLFLSASAPQHGEEPAAEKNRPMIYMPSQNASGLNFPTAAPWACLLVSRHKTLSCRTVTISGASQPPRVSEL